MPEGKLSEAGIRRSIEGSLKRLQTDYIDLYTEHQMEDGSEEQVAYVMGVLIKEGKIRGWGQSSPSATAGDSRRPLPHRYAKRMPSRPSPPYRASIQ